MLYSEAVSPRCCPIQPFSYTFADDNVAASLRQETHWLTIARTALVVVWLTAICQLARAARTNPIEALRYE